MSDARPTDPRSTDARSSGDVLAELLALRAALTARRQDSVPPDVTEPTTTSDPWNVARARATSARSITATDVNVVGSRPLTGRNAVAARSASASRSGRPGS